MPTVEQGSIRPVTGIEQGVPPLIPRLVQCEPVSDPAKEPGWRSVACRSTGQKRA